MFIRVDRLSPEEHFKAWEKVASTCDEVISLSAYNRASGHEFEWFCSHQSDVETLKKRYPHWEFSHFIGG